MPQFSYRANATCNRKTTPLLSRCFEVLPKASDSVTTMKMIYALADSVSQSDVFISRSENTRPRYQTNEKYQDIFRVLEFLRSWVQSKIQSQGPPQQHQEHYRKISTSWFPKYLFYLAVIAKPKLHRSYV